MADRYGVVIVGGGNAAFRTAHAAREQIDSVLVLEKAPRDRAGAGLSIPGVGRPEQARDELERYRAEVGVTDVLLRLDPAGMPLDLIERSLRLFGEKVLPALATT